MKGTTSDYSRYDPYSKEVMADPQPFYRYLRAHAPVLYLEKYDLWVFSRFQDIVDLLAIGENSLIASESTLPGPFDLLQHNHGQVKERELEPVLPIGSLLGSPHYEVLRQAHIKPFLPRRAASLADLIRGLANRQLDHLIPKGRFDLTQEYGGIVAASVICHLYDMPAVRAREVLELVNQLSLTDPEAGGTDVGATVGRSVEIILPYVAKRRTAGADGSVSLIDGLVNLRYYGRPLTDAEIAMQLVCVFIGGTETAPKIAAHGLMELARAPLQLAEVREDVDANVPMAVEEMIRFCAPAQWFLRTAHKDITVAGHDIKTGQRVMVLFASAGRDENEFEEPDRFIWNRDIKRQLAFGYGQHFCIGVHLARLELRILVQEFLRRVPAYRFDMEQAVRLPSSFQWGWNKLPVIVAEAERGAPMRNEEG
jgi:cytochrome P450